MTQYSEAVRTAQAYYNSDDAENFYSRLWGGEDIHIGLYESDSEAVVDASHRTVEHMCDLLGPALDGATVLDIGGGYGGSARYIAQHHNADVVSLNLSEVQNERARRKNAERGLDQRVSIVDGDFENIPFDDAHFDIVWSQDAMLRDVRGATMTSAETESVNAILSEIGTLFNTIRGGTLRQLEANQTLAQHIETFNNTYVRKGARIKDPKQHARKLITWIKSKYAKEISLRKTAKGKATQKQKMNDLLDFFDSTNLKNLEKMFELQKLIVDAKLILINKLNRIGSLETFVKTNKGYKVTGQEGYVAIDKLGGDAVKIVDRMEFSYANFSPDILKGWDKPGRN